MGKLLLPHLGSGAQIWSVAMLSYQLFLLLGYLYAYLFILITSILLLPLSFTPENLESTISSPEKWLITSLTKNIAFFFILLSANTLIIQNLIANTKHKKSKKPLHLIRR